MANVAGVTAIQDSGSGKSTIRLVKHTAIFLKIYSSEFDLAPKLCSRSATGERAFQLKKRVPECYAEFTTREKSRREKNQRIATFVHRTTRRKKYISMKITAERSSISGLMQRSRAGYEYMCIEGNPSSKARGYDRGKGQEVENATIASSEGIMSIDRNFIAEVTTMAVPKFTPANIKEAEYNTIGNCLLRNGSRHRSRAAPTSINIESLHYDNSKLPFPSVTLCPNVRVDWNRALELEPRIFSNDIDETSLEIFRKILGRLSVMTFGDFDEMDFLKNHNVRNLSGINITQVLYDVMPSCDQFLSACWWRNADRNCCEIFEVQKTEYGFCYSFNSEMAVTSLADPTESRPRKASSYGEWSGIKVTIHPGNITKPPDSSKVIGNTNRVIFYV
ncbi:Sodium channel protein Nach [Camponotus floridanus]|uniref:Sodium channel protein Nach n=1 Tax=Camponotus floridanus TaxID=104421 RepID=E2AQU1_CAMFO|nr:Sodium channel protein Nach [Camponotus floridanus]